MQNKAAADGLPDLGGLDVYGEGSGPSLGGRVPNDRRVGNGPLRPIKGRGGHHRRTGCSMTPSIRSYAASPVTALAALYRRVAPGRGRGIRPLRS